MEPVKNVVFLIVDDLRPELNCYGQNSVKSPHIDQLAQRSVKYNRAYCQVPVCGASRASLLTGVEPQRSRFIDFFARADEDAKGIKTLPEHLIAHGFKTLSRGKVFHHVDDATQSWSEAPWQSTIQSTAYVDPENRRNWEEIVSKPRIGNQPHFGLGPAWEAVDAPDDAYTDAQTADQLIRDLDAFEADGGPFFLAGGFYRPHLPFLVPKPYWDLYDPAEIQPNFMDRPTDVPAEMLHKSGELWRMYTSVHPENLTDEDTARNLIHGYWASVSFLDAQIGRVLDHLDTLSLKHETAVVLCVDHGWNLGEHGQWCKHCLYETSLHVPLIIHLPGQEEGSSIDHPVSNLDLYPTILDLLAVPTPEHDLAGQVLHQTDASTHAPVFSRFHNGESIRTERWRYSEWRNKDGGVTGRTLFDHHSDPQELRNLAALPDHEDVVKELSGLLRWM